MRIGIDAHIILPKHKRYNPKIAQYTEDLITHVIKEEAVKGHTLVLFFDSRMEGTDKMKQFEKLFAGARLNVFHSPEGLIPYVYPGKIVTTFHYVPRGESESGIFVRTFMLGARLAFWQLCKRASRIIVNTAEDKKLLMEKHGYPQERIVLMNDEDISKVNWKKRTKELVKVYEEVGGKKAKAKLETIRRPA